MVDIENKKGNRVVSREENDKPGSVLIVEDSPTQAEKLKYFLEEEGYQVTLACDGKQALVSLKTVTPILIISDIVMPEMDGYELCRNIKANTKLRDIPIILLTAMIEPEYIVKGLQCGADHFITKPYEKDNLLSHIQYVLSNRELRRKQKMGITLDFIIGGKEYSINSDRLQLLDCLISTYETAFQQNKDLLRLQNELRSLNDELESRVEERTSELKNEIIQHKQADDTLRQSEEKYRQLVNNLSEGIWVIDQDSVTTFVNPSLAEMLGYNTAEMFGRRVLSFTDEQNAKRAAPYLARLKEGLNEQIALEFLRKDGERVYVSLQMSPVIDKYSNYNGAIAGVQNVTERKKLQDQLTAQDRLVTIGQFASGIAHELNNPLTGVIGFSELLLGRDLVADVKADLEIVNREAQRAAVIVKGLLTFARKPGTEKAPVNINSIIQGVLQLRSYEEKVCNIVINNRCAPDLPEITGNGAQLQQAFINLIVNAEQAMLEAHNRGTLTIVTERIADILKVSIADDGPGISPENMSKIFIPFFTTKEVGKGTGLGLSICYGIITEHGGKIYCESQPGKGATFVVELPIGKVAEQNTTS